MTVAMSLEPVIAFLRGLLLLYLLLDATPSHAQSIEDLKKGVVKITAQADGKTKVGTGFIVKLNSEIVYIMTAAHVISGDSQPKVQFFSRQEMPVRAQVKHTEGGDDETGMALLTVRGKENVPTGLVALQLATTIRASGGEDIMMIGHPVGAGDWAIIKGSIASRQGRYLKVDANIDEGSSGGPIIHARQVVGLIGGTQRYGKGVTIGTVREYLEGHGVLVSAPAPHGSDITQAPLPKEIIGKDGAPMVLIPAGEYTMGSREEDKGVDNDERPAHRVNLDAFYIDQYEVTNSRYAKFFQKTKRAAPTYWSEQVLKQHGNKPVVGVDWSDASAYCAWARKRLPTEAEWERAARGTDQRLYPWGDTTPDRSFANLDNCCDFKNHSALTEVGSLGRGKSPYGVYDMAGNVWEWVADWYDESYYIKSPERNPNGPSQGILRVVRGGAWTSNPVSVRSAFRDKLSPSNRRAAQDGDLGFRCAQDAKEEVTR